MTKPSESGKIKELSQLLKESKNTFVLTGAGMSTESGIPDFRSPSGWWKNIDPLTVATVEALENQYELFHEFYCCRVKALASCKPHEGHFVLAHWQEKGLLQRVATQNVDGFHAEAGNMNVDELHGSIRTYRCHSCATEATKDQFFAKESCEFCGGNFRPNVVLFGEMLPESAWNHALSNIKRADLVIVIGTSLQVYPVSQLPTMTHGKTVYINQDVSEHQLFFDLSIEGSAKETLVGVNKLV
ncbi:NAD-dependent protein deacetylase of SIR2 family [Halalkalibacter wakoensis JCM 9140]|uniref:protein acetyllysine N-acetyltransferase n=1 Tax=Halalkalibacter wakoensis JCM 9140 TaxID=1236970 RepID=W4Q2L5_9BACI|nr:NAD-dependent deacylase [Halalkalibacter wakoensis]GAE25948.1 NAD-dependent protein deacetylase of SIR2 family [Halalkalibacter wakoensis JCM 9140]